MLYLHSERAIEGYCKVRNIRHGKFKVPHCLITMDEHSPTPIVLVVDHVDELRANGGVIVYLANS